LLWQLPARQYEPPRGQQKLVFATFPIPTPQANLPFLFKNSTILQAIFWGEIDAHDPKYDHLEVTKVLVDLDADYTKVPEGRCVPKL
jgi:hypothetical protein